VSSIIPRIDKFKIKTLYEDSDRILFKNAFLIGKIFFLIGLITQQFQSNQAISGAIGLNMSESLLHLSS